MKQRRIICSAIRFSPTTDDDPEIVVCGVRHYDMLMNNQLNLLPRVVGVETQGFVDNFGQFLTRTEAWIVADEADQIVHRCGGDCANGGTLYSENLY